MGTVNYWSITSIVLKEEAEKLWFKVEVLSIKKNLFFIKWNKKEILFKSNDFWWDSSLWAKLENDKELTYKILERNNLPVADTLYISKENINEIDNLDITFPVIIKPIEECHWNWVMMNIINIQELKIKLDKSFKKYDKMIIQRQIKWDEYRFLVVKWEVILVINRVPASVKWNWKDDIETLIEDENESNILRWEWYKSPLAYINIDKELIDYIWKKWLNISYTPKQWEKIQLRWNSNIWTWWFPIDVTSITSESIKDIACLSAKIFWLEIAGVDIITTDITKSLEETGWIILELNATPWLWGDRELTSVNTWKVILEKLFF